MSAKRNPGLGFIHLISAVATFGGTIFLFGQEKPLEHGLLVPVVLAGTIFFWLSVWYARQ